MRIKKLADSLKDVDGCVIDCPVDLYYLTGLTLSKGRLWVAEKESCLFVDGRYFESAKAKAPCTVRIWDEYKSVLEKAKRVAFDSAFVTYNEAFSLKNAFPRIEWVPIPSPTKFLRVCKDPQEIASLKKAAQLTWRGYEKILSAVKEGITEYELALEFEFFCRKNGASGLSFDSIIAFGENSAYPHYRAGHVKLKKNQLILIDIGAVVDGYAGDMTRVFHFGGVSSELARFEKIVKGAQEKAIQAVRPGLPIGHLDQIVRDIFDQENVKQLYIHNLGHGIGLETHEFPRVRFDNEDRDLLLKPGMVFTIEPGLYKTGLGGIRWEDMILVTEDGHEVISGHA